MSLPPSPPRTGAKKRATGSTPKSSVPKSSAGASAKGMARREEILIGLMNRLSRQELRNPSLREIGRALGIEPAHILYYFSSREELLQQVIIRWDEDARRAAPEGGDTLDDFARHIRRNMTIPGIMHLYLTFAAEAVEAQHPAHDFFLKRFEAVSARLEHHIRLEQAEGTIPASVNPASRARQLIALSDGLQLQSLVDPTVDAYGEMMDAIAALRQKS